ncbi:MAG: hypothetical protein AAB360_01600 [Patescibacteria group bacterium]
MALDKNDIKIINDLLMKSEDRIISKVDSKIDFAVEKLELRLENVEHRLENVELRLKNVERSIDDLIETNQAFLELFNDHEKRITRLETKVL